LQKGGKLSVFIGGNAATGVGGLSVKFGGIVRDPRTGSPHPLHLEIILQEGSRKLVDEKACAFDSYSWQHAKGKHVLCWF
jgi:hypothetical protein